MVFTFIPMGFCFFFLTLILFWETIYKFGSHLLSVFINAYNVSFKSSPRGETVIKPIIEMVAAPSYKINRHIFWRYQYFTDDVHTSVLWSEKHARRRPLLSSVTGHSYFSATKYESHLRRLRRRKLNTAQNINHRNYNSAQILNMNDCKEEDHRVFFLL